MRKSQTTARGRLVEIRASAEPERVSRIAGLSYRRVRGRSCPFVKIVATGLAAGIVLDATVVRALLVPALISLLGDWNWWLPNWMASALRIPAPPNGRMTPDAQPGSAATP
jgi:hypothetical protein